MADHGCFDNLSAAQRHDERDDPAVGEIDIFDSGTGLEKNRLVPQLNEFEMRMQKFEV